MPRSEETDFREYKTRNPDWGVLRECFDGDFSDTRLKRIFNSQAQTSNMERSAYFLLKTLLSMDQTERAAYVRDVLSKIERNPV